MTRQTNLLFSIFLLLACCFSQPAFAQTTSASLEAACAVNASERVYVITNTSAAAGTFFIFAVQPDGSGADAPALVLPLAPNEEYIFTTTAVSVLVFDENFIPLTSLEQFAPNVCEAPLEVADTCWTVPGTYAWVLNNPSTDPVTIDYVVNKGTASRTTITGTSGNITLVPGEFVYLETDTVIGDAMCVFYENGLVDTITNTAGQCVDPTPSVTIEAACAPTDSERRYVITSTAAVPIQVPVFAVQADGTGGSAPEFILPLAPGEEYVFTTTAISVLVFDETFVNLLGSLDQFVPDVCVAPIAASDTCWTVPGTYAWVLNNPSTESVTLDYIVNKGTASRTTITTPSGTITLAPGEGAYLETDTTAGDAMCLFYDNGLVDTIVNNAGACVIPPTITIDAECALSETSRTFIINNESDFAADLLLFEGTNGIFNPLQLEANQSYRLVTSETFVFVTDNMGAQTYASLDQSVADLCVAPIAVNDTCSDDATYYSWVMYNNTSEVANVFYLVDKQNASRVVNITSNSDSIEVLPGDTVLIDTEVAAGDRMCVFYENGLVDTIYNDAGACPVAPVLTVEAECALFPAERNYLITNTSDFGADLVIEESNGRVQELAIDANGTLVINTNATSIDVLFAYDNSLLGSLAQPTVEICVPPVAVTDTCSTGTEFYTWVFYNLTDEPTIVSFEPFDEFSTSRVINITSDADTIEILPGDTVIVNVTRGDEDRLTVYFDNGIVETYTHAGEICEVLDIEIAATAVCSNDANLNRFRFENTNDFEVVLAYEGTTATLPAAGDGLTLDENPGGNFTFIETANTVNPLVVAYGNDQTLSIDYTAGVCDDTPDPQSCEGNEFTYTLSNAASDPAYHGANHNHSIDLHNFYSGGAARFSFDADAYMVLNEDESSAYITGNATMTQGPLVGSRWVVYAPFGAPQSNTGVKKELRANAYDPADGNVDIELWKTYLMESSAFMRQLDGDNYISMTTRPANGDLGLQVGKGANGKNINLGAATWFSYSYNGASYKTGDFNLDLKEFCPPVSIEVAALCIQPDMQDRNRWSIENTTDRFFTVQYSIDGGAKMTQFVPAAGNGSDLDGNANAGDYTFFDTPASDGSTLTVFYNFTQEATVAASTELCAIPEGTIDVVNVCIDNKNKNKWRIRNDNNFAVDVVLAHNGATVTLPAAGSGADLDGNANAGNYTFVKTTKSVTTFSFTYGDEQSASADFVTGLCSMNPDPESCDGDRVTYTLSNAVSDEYHSGNHDHSIWLSNFNGEGAVRMTFDADAYLVYRDNGSKAYITGNATMTQGSLAGSRWVVYAPFENAGDNTVGKKELKANAYDPADGAVDVELWKTFLMKESAFMRQLDGDGYINMTRMPADGKYGLQIGKGANGKNVNLGGSAWFSYSYNGQSYRQGDFNLDLKDYCPPVEITVDALCKDKPWRNSWRITNSTDRFFRIQYSIDGGEKKTRFIPKAGKGRDADNNAASGDFTFINANVNDGSVLTVYYSLDQEISVEADSVYCPVPEGSIDVVNVCTNASNKRKWVVTNTNDFDVFVTLAHNGNTIKVAASSEKTFNTGKAIDTFEITFGAGQSASADFTTGPCSVTPDPESCDNGNWTFDLSDAVSDEYHGGNSNHSISLSGLGRLHFDDGAYLVYNSSGDRAYITGTATMYQGSLSGTKWEVFAPFTAKNDNTVGKKELRANAYDPTDGGVDVDTWALFLMEDGAFMNQLDGDNYITMSTMPADGKYGLQIGKGANGKNVEFGASSWFFYSLNGATPRQGDFNLNLGAQCDAIDPCSIFYIDNTTDKIYLTTPKYYAGKANLKEYVPSPYGGAHIALNIDGTKLFVFKSGGDHEYGYYDTRSHIFKTVGNVNIEGGIVQASFNPQGHLYFSSTESDEIFVLTDPLDPSTQENFGKIKIQETGEYMNIAGADMAFDQDGSFYIATHAHGGAIFTVSGMKGHLLAKQFGHACRGKITGMAVLGDSKTLIYSVKDAGGMYIVYMDNPSYGWYFPFEGPLTKSGWGDMTSACLDYVAPCDGNATRVVNFHQGRQQDGGLVPDNRSNPEQALGAPQENDTYNFVSLGFRGYIELELASPVYNHNKNGVEVGNNNSIESAYGNGLSYADFVIVETSFGKMNLNCGPDQTGNYPELALVYGKEKESDPWVLLTPTTVCRTSFIDIGPAVRRGDLEYVKFVKILDCTDYARHSGNADGYDVDGIIICPDEVVGAITGEGRGALVNARTNGDDENASHDLNLEFVNTVPNDAEDDLFGEVVFNVYPNPSKGKITVTSNLGYVKPAALTVFSADGREVYNSTVSGESEMNIDLSQYGSGVYIVKMSNDTDTRTLRVVIQ